MIDDIVQHPKQPRNGFRRNSFADDGVANGLGDISELLLKVASLLCEFDDGLARILLALAADYDTLCLHPLQKWRDGIGLQQQALGDVIHRLFVFFPQYQQHQVLRICKAVLTQQRMIRLSEQP